MRTKAETFFTKLDTLVSGLDTNKVKTSIGDSINNNRTLTVNQVVRYLLTRRDKKLKKLGSSLKSLNVNLGPSIVASRTSSRTDALDINEFLDTFDNEVVNGSISVRRDISSLIT